MSTALLGRRFDLHGGGADLQFPHHENEIAQSDGAYFPEGEDTFVRYWMHNGFVQVDEEKMSKSLGNFFTIREVLERYDGEVIRFFILRSHYRSPLNYSPQGLEEAGAYPLAPPAHRAFASPSFGAGSIGWPSCRISKCSSGRSASPVWPPRPIRSPARTVSPFFTVTRLKWP